MKPEPRNPFYVMLLAVSFAFAVTVLAVALVPLERQPAWLREYSLTIVLAQVAAMIVFGLLSMGLDQVRQRRSKTDSR